MEFEVKREDHQCFDEIRVILLSFLNSGERSLALNLASDGMKSHGSCTHVALAQVDGISDIGGPNSDIDL